MANRKKVLDDIVTVLLSLRKKLFDSHSHHKHLDLTPAQGQILFMVHHFPGISLSDLAKKLSVSKSATTQMVDGMVGNGLLFKENNDDDKRSFNIHLSDKSLKKFKVMKEMAIKKFSSLFSCLSDDELSEFLRLSKKVVKNHLKNDN